MADQMETNATNSTIPTIYVHPFVMMNISHHWTRIKEQNEKEEQVFGTLTGKYSGRNIEICDSYELKMDRINDDGDDEVIINRKYYDFKEQQYKQVFGKFDILGWYTTGEFPTIKEIKIQKQIYQINGNKIMLQMNPNSGENISESILIVYESIIDISHDKTIVSFVPTEYKLITQDSERITIDCITNSLSNDTDNQSLIIERLTAQYNSIKKLYNHMKTILSYVKSVEREELTSNQELLRNIQSICNLLPTFQKSPEFYREFSTQLSDTNLMTYLTVLTKTCNSLNSFVNHYNVLNSSKNTSNCQFNS